jgi:uncharacterized membrane protein YdcZ (DUF606 family)/SAM-dependent methyltransferase
VLGTRVGSALLASLVNFTAAFLVVVVALALRPQTRAMLRRIGSWPVPRWTLTAGLGGALIVVAGTFAVETIGVAIFSVAFFAGQIVFGLIVDRLGVGPGGVRRITAVRIQAALVAIAAVVASQIGRPVGEFAVAQIALVVAAGAGFTFQSAFNGRITLATGDPVAATAVNVVVGLTALASIVGVMLATGVVDAAPWPAEPWLYLGGVLGVSIVFALAVATAALGVFRVTLALLAAQLVAAFAVDAIMGSEAPTLGVLIGAVLIVVAVALAMRERLRVAPPAEKGVQMPSLSDIKTRQQATWSSGAYDKIAWFTLPLADRLIDAVDLPAGSKTVDVATGTGHVALAAARRFCDSTGVDYVPALLDVARRRAEAEDLDVTFEEGDAEALRFDDGTFDYVFSAIGVMFTADHAKAASELVRVCRPGGTIGLVNWTPQGFVGDMFRTIAKHVPPPPEAKPPGLWGTEDYLKEILGGGVTLAIDTGSIAMRFLSPEHFADFFIEHYGPTLKAYQSLPDDGKTVLRADLVGVGEKWNRATDGTAIYEFEYIIAIAKKS